MLHYSIAFLKVKVLYVWGFFSGDDQHSTELGRQDPGWTDGDTNWHIPCTGGVYGDAVTAGSVLLQCYVWNHCRRWWKNGDSSYIWWWGFSCMIHIWYMHINQKRRGRKKLKTKSLIEINKDFWQLVKLFDFLSLTLSPLS